MEVDNETRDVYFIMVKVTIDCTEMSRVLRYRA